MASSLAKESHFCDTPDVPCGNVPAILFAGLMPLNDPNYFDAGAGYALRPNRPIPPSGPRQPAKTPFLQTLQLYGCVNVANAKFYRVLLSNNNGGSFSAITASYSSWLVRWSNGLRMTNVEPKFEPLAESKNDCPETVSACATPGIPG